MKRIYKFIMIVVFIFVVSAGIWNDQSKAADKIQIVPIGGSLKVELDSENERCTVSEKLLIINPSGYPGVNKKAVRAYESKYPIAGNRLREAIENARHEYRQAGGDLKDSYYNIFKREYFRVSDETPETWDGEPDFGKKGRERFHLQDLMARSIIRGHRSIILYPNGAITNGEE